MASPPRQSPPLFSPEPAARRKDRPGLRVLLLMALCAASLAVEMWHFRPFLPDNAADALRNGQRLLAGPVGSNLLSRVNLLWILLCAALRATGMTFSTAATLLGITGTVAGLIAVGAQVYRDFPAKVRFVAALLACLAVCCSAPIAAWAVGGFEQPLVAACVAWAAYFALRWIAGAKGSPRDADAAGLLLALALLLRLNAALFTPLFLAGAVLADGVRIRSILTRLRLLPIPVLVFLAAAILRHAYTGAWAPGLRSAVTLHTVSTGLHYDLVSAAGNSAFFLMTLIGTTALWIAGKRRQVILLATVAAGWLLVVLLTGGDPLPAARQFLPAMMVMAFLIAGCGLLTLSAPFRFSRVRLAIFLTLALLALTSDLVWPAHTTRPGQPEGAPHSLHSTGKDVPAAAKRDRGPAHATLASAPPLADRT